MPFPVRPAKGQKSPRITLVFGGRDSGYAAGFHTGTDFGWTRDVEEVRLTRGGTVVAARYDNAYGNFVCVKVRTVRDRLKARYVYYCHLEDRSKLKVGQKVKLMQLVGIMGQSGNARGRHLHYEERLAGNRYGADSVKPILLGKSRNIPKALAKIGWV